MCHENESWTRSLPIILLGLRTIWRGDFKATPAELLYGESICLPCDFFEEIPSFNLNLNSSKYSKQPSKISSQFLFHITARKNLFIFKHLKDCSHVFTRTDSVRGSLQPPYHGPYKVINRSVKVFTLFTKDKNVNVSIDRLKPCFFDNFSESDIESSIGEYISNKPAEMPEKKIRFAPLPLPPSTRVTRGGCEVRLPVRYQ
ncbi:uncharacterized protein TNIN_15561 [Trichonephila inaurata madagascariensis]|uniref:Uncharacterized protein n=1 Tax=Trichonephila inaurata madagascariensis TaxID=2747483 RepID=A0A8X7CIC9_9ARAC|nr:uncharacterized protein TNIN_15561 [Trichonephila inaurata madagascariensis]